MPPPRSSRTGSAACAHKVKLTRLYRGWRQSEQVGTSLSGIQGLELGRKSPTVRTLDAIARALGVQTWTLLVPDRGATAPSRTRVSRRVIE